MRLLLQRPDTDVNLATYYGTTALTFAIRSGNVAAVGPQLTPSMICTVHYTPGAGAAGPPRHQPELPEPPGRERAVRGGVLQAGGRGGDAGDPPQLSGVPQQLSGVAVSNPSCQVDIVDQHDRTPFLVACQYGWV